MPIEQDLDARLKQALRDKDQATLDVVRMIKSKVQERRTAKGFSGEVDDALLLDVMAAYRKQLQKAAEEYEKAGERGREALARRGASRRHRPLSPESPAAAGPGAQRAARG